MMSIVYMCKRLVKLSFQEQGRNSRNLLRSEKNATPNQDDFMLIEIL